MKRIRDTDWPIAPLTPEDFPGGKYIASFRDWDQKQYFGQEKVRLDFVIVEPPAYAGLFVSYFATCEKDLNKRSSKDSNWYKLWVRVNGGLPRRGQRMTPTIFRGYWQVVVGWGCHKKTGAPTIPVVKEILERVAGGPA